MSISSIKDCDLQDKVVLLRVDFNVPIKNGEIQDNMRILRALNTIEYLMNAGAKVVIISHFGRPEGRDENLSLKNIVKALSQLLNKGVNFVDDCIGEKVQKVVNTMAAGDVTLLENLRFYKEEEQNDLNFAQQLSSIADVYVNDAFSCSHRAHASIARITEFLPSYIGFSMQDELKYLEESISFQAKPITAIVGGAKISTKIKMLKRLAEKVDFLILGGAIANSFLSFNKVNIGKSLFQAGIDDLLHSIVEIANKNNCKIIVPKDVLVAINSDYSVGIAKKIESIADNDVILDIGPQTLETISGVIANSKTVLWNGPIGMFEYPAFATGTKELMNIISNFTKKGNLISVIGGGDSSSAINAAGFTDKDFTYVSTGGGAFLSWLSGDMHAMLKLF
ncbi:phosphoglycerate kinase [Wolbachia endosymbiont of Pentalonia nigronervosa]|uniref:phosphoglycerate kinase n=1 Tax=Wolbachia endosymbiont of Pentalonia nigronervosa TaxID=1301914 RepID=UPI00165F248F|nr:phosphoglycerate kinase [Wolbachia endosymbiont of Pentalonia nigronervosa]MBD0390985.1 phosphoglycerate kinase [Wolbachia endosymbiont of Pentalonia nigronervosa]